MRTRSAIPQAHPRATSPLDGPFWLVLALAGVLVALIGVGIVRTATRPATVEAPSATPDNPRAFLVDPPRDAPDLALTDQTGSGFSRSALIGKPALVFFGYTHCPDVCPATVGILGLVATAYTPGIRVVFVTVDPERDTVAFLADYVRYLPAGFSALTGTAAQVRATADAWGVRYARVEGSTPDTYSMSHTADVYLLDAAGRLRARFPFGTSESAMLATVRWVAGSSAPTGSGDGGQAGGTPAATDVVPPATVPPSPAGGTSDGTLGVEVVSSTVWAGGSSPVIIGLSVDAVRLADPGAHVTVQLTSTGGASVGPAVAAVAVRPPGVDAISYVATLAIPAPGWWSLTVTADSGGSTRTGRGSLAALDPGTTVALGGPAPRERTPTLDDVGGDILRISTDPLPDPRLSTISTVDALDTGRPFVLVIDSARFKVTEACGKALGLAKFMVDRWPSIPFIHLEPYAYDVVTDTATLVGSLAAPTLVPAARAWGLGGTIWGAGSMPWVYVVDRHGTVRAKYQGVIGSSDLDVILAMLQTEG